MDDQMNDNTAEFIIRKRDECAYCGVSQAAFLAQHARIAELEKELREQRCMVAQVAILNGGTVRVPQTLLQDCDSTITRTEHPSGEIIFTVKSAKEARRG